MTTTKVINGVKLVEVPFSVNFNVCIEEHKYLEYVTNGVPTDAMVEAGKSTLLDSIKPVMEKSNEGWTYMMLEVANAN
jgi:hypothetical protein